jgi:hypothetical protein
MKEQRITACNSHDNVLALGDKKGYVFPFEEESQGSGAMGQVKTRFEQLHEGGKRGNSEITQILYLPRCSMIALLCNNVVNIVQSQDISSVQELKARKIHMFCPNNAVYQSESSMLSDDVQVSKISSLPLTD